MSNEDIDAGIVESGEKPRRAPVKRAQPHKPSGVKQPTDRKKSAAQREAEGDETITLTHCEVDFEIPGTADDILGEVNEAFERMQIVTGLRILFGTTKWAEYRKGYLDDGVLRKPTVRDDRALYNLIAAEYGFNSLGE